MAYRELVFSLHVYRLSNRMTDFISLQVLTNAFESETGIKVEEDTRTYLYQDITAAVKNTLYVMN